MLTTNKQAFWYQPELSSTGRWARQGSEAWANFKFNSERWFVNSGYNHELRMIVWFDRKGNCYGEDHSSGPLPRGGSHYFAQY